MTTTTEFDSTISGHHFGVTRSTTPTVEFDGMPLGSRPLYHWFVDGGPSGLAADTDDGVARCAEWLGLIDSDER